MSTALPLASACLGLSLSHDAYTPTAYDDGWHMAVPRLQVTAVADTVGAGVYFNTMVRWQDRVSEGCSRKSASLGHMLGLGPSLRRLLVAL